jgi:hypothetical protein
MTGFYHIDGVLETDPRKIADRYAKGCVYPPYSIMANE